jgi:hypothetical protein
MIKSAFIGIVVLLLLPLGAGALAAQGRPLAEGAGTVQEIDLAAETLIIDGMIYAAAVDVSVEIGGSYGAFTMLEPGMRVYYEFLRLSDRERIVTLIRELPEQVDLDGV